MIKNLPLLSVLFWSLTVSLVASAAVPPESALTYKGSQFSYFTSASLNTPNPLIKQAIIVVHGSDRNADTYYNTMAELSAQQGFGSSTLVISPHFKLATDSLLPHELTWTDESWLRGDSSLSNAQVTSFEMVDDLVKLISNPAVFPQLKTIVVTGHSAGGQFTQRYALGSSEEDQLKNIRFRYVVANPGSYVYLSPKRPDMDSSDPQTPTFHIPFFPACAYDDYKYGLQHLNPYLKQVPLPQMLARYLARDITYFLGENDVLTAELDETCPAEYQGHTRIERGRNFKAMLDSEYPKNLHHLKTVPGVGHTEWGMYSSTNGLVTLFQGFVSNPSP